MSLPGVARLVLLSLALWTAVYCYRGERPLRFLAGLVAGAWLCHLGWGGLHWDVAVAQPEVLLDPLVGACVLFLPLGPLLLAREAPTWRALPAALAVARVGCVPVGCCYEAGGPWEMPLGASVEIGAWLALHGLLGRAPDARALPAFAAGFGGVRLLLVPWRQEPSTDAAGLSSTAIAMVWVVCGVWGLARAGLFRPRRERRVPDRQFDRERPKPGVGG